MFVNLCVLPTAGDGGSGHISGSCHGGVLTITLQNSKIVRDVTKIQVIFSKKRTIFGNYFFEKNVKFWAIFWQSNVNFLEGQVMTSAYILCGKGELKTVLLISIIYNLLFFYFSFLFKFKLVVSPVIGCKI